MATEHVFAVARYQMSMKWFNSLNKEDQALITKAMDESVAFSNELTKNGDANFVKQLVEKGMILVEVDKKAFKEAAMPVIDALAIGSSALFSAWMSSPPLPFTIYSQKMLFGLQNFLLVAIPLFILAAKLMNTAGITERLKRIFIETTHDTAVIGFLVACASFYGWILMRSGLTLKFAEFFLGISQNPMVILLIEPLSKLVFFVQAIFKNPYYIRVYEFRRVSKVDF